jgi:predicted phosphodiesterase
LRPQAVDALRGSDLIIHAGDLPDTTVAEAGTVLLYVLHDVHALDLDPVAAGIHIVVSGHSHQPGQSERNGVLYINPGSAGPRRFQLPVSLALLNVDRKSFKVEFVELEA